MVILVKFATDSFATLRFLLPQLAESGQLNNPVSTEWRESPLSYLASRPCWLKNLFWVPAGSSAKRHDHELALKALRRAMLSQIVSKKKISTLTYDRKFSFPETIQPFVSYTNGNWMEDRTLSHRVKLAKSTLNRCPLLVMDELEIKVSKIKIQTPFFVFKTSSVRRWWAGLDSNQRRRNPADLQSAKTCFHMFQSDRF